MRAMKVLVDEARGGGCAVKVLGGVAPSPTCSAAAAAGGATTAAGAATATELGKSNAPKRSLYATMAGRKCLACMWRAVRLSRFCR